MKYYNHFLLYNILVGTYVMKTILISLHIRIFYVMVVLVVRSNIQGECIYIQKYEPPIQIYIILIFFFVDRRSKNIVLLLIIIMYS